MTTLADLTRQVARLVTRTVIGATTSAPGNATQIIDTVNLAGFPDDQFLGGTAWITSGANAGLSRVVTAFSNSADRLTCAAFTSNILSGVTFEVATSDVIEYRDLRQAVNLALREAGYIMDDDETLTVVENQLIYTLPAGVSNVQEVWVVEDLDDVDDQREYLNNHWREEEGYLIFEYGREPHLDTDTKLRIKYLKFHTEMASDADVLNYQIDEQSLVHLAARHAMRLSYKRFGKAGNETIPEWLNEAAEQAMKHVRPHRRGYVKVKTA